MPSSQFFPEAKWLPLFYLEVVVLSPTTIKWINNNIKTSDVFSSYI
jgi:hypothetical protein